MSYINFILTNSIRNRIRVNHRDSSLVGPSQKTRGYLIGSERWVRERADWQLAYTVWLGGTNLDSGDERVVDPNMIPDAVSKYNVDIAHELVYCQHNDNQPVD